jgi:hypothetical protein
MKGIKKYNGGKDRHWIDIPFQKGELGRTRELFSCKYELFFKERENHQEGDTEIIHQSCYLSP